MRHAQDALNAARVKLAKLHPTYRQAAAHAKPSFAVAAAMCSPKPGLRCAAGAQSARGRYVCRFVICKCNRFFLKKMTKPWLPVSPQMRARVVQGLRRGQDAHRAQGGGDGK